MEGSELRRRSAAGEQASMPAEGTTEQSNSTRKLAISDARRSTWSATGLAVYASFLAASTVYFYVRFATTLDLGHHKAYAHLVFWGELFGAICVALYGLSIVRRMPDVLQHISNPGNPPQLHFDLQVLVPCYTEALEIVTETVWAARMAQVPSGCTATVWLLDDGHDEEKQAWVSGMADPHIQYISGRRRPKGEVNGKAGNLNNAMSVIYASRGTPAQLGAHDVLAVFDCDQVCSADFFMQTLPLMARSGDVAMVLTPQQFGNVDEASDIFNHTNRHFWEVMIPGLTAWGMLVCTGSNFLVRAAAVQAIGGFPTQTITEDYMLSLELAKRGFQSSYLQQYLATGEAPEEGAIFRQRSRWCKGHIQALLSAENPMLQQRLSWKLRIFYTMGTLSYICAAITVPLFAAVPVIAVATGTFPLALNPTFAAVFPVYFVLMHSVVYFCGSWGLLRALWFGGCSTQILWFTYLKAIVNTMLWAAGLKKKGRFKTTIKTGALAAHKSQPVTPRTPAVPFTPGRGEGGEEPQQRPFSKLRPAGSGAFDLERRSSTHIKTAGSGVPVSASSVSSKGGEDSSLRQRALGVRWSGELDRSAQGSASAPPAASPEQAPADAVGAQAADARSRLSESSGPGPEGLSRSSGLKPSGGSGLPRPRHRPSLSLSTMSSLSRVASTLERSLLSGGSGALARQQTGSIPELNRHLSEIGRRPSWNFQAKPIAPKEGEKPEAFDLMRVRHIAYGRLRDLWAPLSILILSVAAVCLGLQHLLHSPNLRGVGGSLPGMVTVLWALYNCVGPYLLLHYSCFGRGSSLRHASSICMALSFVLAVSAVVLVYVFVPAAYDYKVVLDAAYRFYEAQRSGKLPADSRVPWRGDSALYDRAPSGASLVGGWYDAGDHLKTSFSTAIATSFLSWGLLQFKQGHAAAGQLGHASDAVRWAAEFLIKAHTAPDVFVGQVGNMDQDHSFWGRPEDLDKVGMPRPAYVINASLPGSDMAGAAAAALASASLVWRQQDARWANTALQHARQLFDFGLRHPGRFSQSVPEMGAVYPSSAWRDDMAWGAAWLHAATHEPAYLQRAHALLNESREQEAGRWEYYVTNWDNLLWATQTLVGLSTRDPTMTAAARNYIDRWRFGEVVNYTRKGLAFSDEWGSLRNAANVAMLAFLVAQPLPADEAQPYECWALGQLRYMLGDGPRSFVVGLGRNPPLRPHHRAASCPPQPHPCNDTALNSPAPNAHVLVGALVGGPDRFDTYPDVRGDYVTSEVGIEYSAGFTAAVAGAIQAQTPVAHCMQGHGALW